MKQTAVEWLEDNLLSEPWTEEHFKYNAECWDKAKEMEKEQIVNAYNDCEWTGEHEDGEQYYNETYESKTNI